MAGPTCEVLFEFDLPLALDKIDAILAAAAGHIDRTRKGRVWDVWVNGRPVHVAVESSLLVVTFSAGCNTPEDYEVLRHLAGEVATALDGVASEPTK